MKKTQKNEARLFFIKGEYYLFMDGVVPVFFHGGLLSMKRKTFPDKLLKNSFERIIGSQCNHLQFGHLVDKVIG